jgi:hypothetical protein
MKIVYFLEPMLSRGFSSAELRRQDVKAGRATHMQEGLG